MIRMIDLFAGVGGIRLGFEQTGLVKTLFSSEKDHFAQLTYRANFGDTPHGDICAIDVNDIPDHDLLVAGFPCQAFSQSGKRRGFADTRGTLFFEIERILEAKRPKAFLLENVKGLITHNKGKTLATILEVLRDKIGYHVQYKVLNSCDYDVPQSRSRIFIVGFKEADTMVSFCFPEVVPPTRTLKDILHAKAVPTDYYLSDKYWQSLKRHKANNQAKGNNFGYQILDWEGIANTLMVGGMGRERNLIIDPRQTDTTPGPHARGPLNTEFVRTMTPREWARLQGFPDTFVIPVSNTQAYKQMGNSVSVPVIHALAQAMLKVM